MNRTRTCICVKAVSEQGERLNIRKATLHEWREEFARHLRVHGVSANATQRFVRGETQPRKSDGIHRAMLRGGSTHVYERVRAIANTLLNGDHIAEPVKAHLLESRTLVEKGWRVVRNLLATSAHPDLASKVDRFIRQMPPPLTENEWFAEQLRQHRHVQTPGVGH